MVFCRLISLDIFKSLYAIFQSALHTLFFCVNPLQPKRVKLKNNVHQRLRTNRRVNGSKGLAVLFLFSVFCLLSSGVAHSASVTLAWDASQEEDVAGYRVYYGTTSGHYTNMIDVGLNTSGSISNLVPGQTYYFAATAYDTGGNESGFSQEIPYIVPFVDSDGDGVADELDAFPLDPAENTDTDGDGTGNNADLDDDDDGMPDAWEIVNNLNPLLDDANGDPDSDGISNLDEYSAGTRPHTFEDQSPPDVPVILTPMDNDIVSHTPELMTDEFYDPDTGDVHAETQWQIYRASDNFCVFDVTSASALTSLRIPKLVLEEDTDYLWKVRFINNHQTKSDWSATATFTTDISDHDLNGNGIPDHQEVDVYVDLDEDGTPDIDQHDIKSLNAPDGMRQIGVSIKGSVTVQSIAAIESENPENLGEGSNTNGKPDSLPFGLLNFKLIVDFPGDEAVVTIYLSEPAPVDAVWYKYDPVDSIWQDYSDFTEFSADRKSIYLTLMDGGFGDADGIENGVIIDPSGLGVSAAPVSTGGGSSAGCFITTANQDSPGNNPMDILRRMRGIELAMMFLVPLLFLYFRKIAKRR